MRECTVRTGRLPIRVWQSAVRVGQSSNPRNAIECSAVGINVPCGEDRRSARGGMSVARGGITCAIGRVSVEPCASASHAVTSTVRLGESPARASRVIVARAAVSVPPGAVVCAAMAIQRCHQGNENIAPFSRRGARGSRAPWCNRSPSGRVEHIRPRREWQPCDECSERSGRCGRRFERCSRRRAAVESSERPVDTSSRKSSSSAFGV